MFFIVRIETAPIMEVDFRPFLLMREAENSQLRRQQKTVATTNIFLFVLSYNKIRTKLMYLFYVYSWRCMVFYTKYKVFNFAFTFFVLELTLEFSILVF